MRAGKSGYSGTEPILTCVLIDEIPADAGILTNSLCCGRINPLGIVSGVLHTEHRARPVTQKSYESMELKVSG